LTDKKHPLEYLSEIQDLMDMNDFMEDEDFGAAVDLALKVIAKPDLPPAAAKKALLQMQGWAFIFKLKAQTYMTIHKGQTGTRENQKKNVYFSLSEQCHELAQSLKYISKEQF
jgi:hypothetical protein